MDSGLILICVLHSCRWSLHCEVCNTSVVCEKENAGALLWHIGADDLEWQQGCDESLPPNVTRKLFARLFAVGSLLLRQTLCAKKSAFNPLKKYFKEIERERERERERKNERGITVSHSVACAFMLHMSICM